jgi:hypothetical protein
MTKSKTSEAAQQNKGESNKEIQLSSRGLQRPTSLSVKDFTFSCGSDSYSCSKFEAGFICPLVRELLAQDITTNEFALPIFEPPLSALSFRDLFSLSRGEGFCITDHNFDSFKCFAKSVGNHELMELLVSFKFGDRCSSRSNALERHLISSFFGLPCSESLDYLASHFYELDAELVRSLDSDDLCLILPSSSLQLYDEDSLVDFILTVQGDRAKRFLCYVHSEYLSVSGIARLLNWISLDDVDLRLWESLCRRLRYPIQVGLLPSSRFVRYQSSFDSSRPLNVIISYLTARFGGNIHTQGIVSISASTTGFNPCHLVADHSWNNYWYSSNSPNSWIQFDFKHRQISLTNYTVKSDGFDGHHLLHWSIEGSEDGSSWVTLDHQDNGDLNGNYIVRSYSCNSSASQSLFRFVRLIQTGANSSNCHNLMLCNLEFFGQLFG